MKRDDDGHWLEGFGIIAGLLAPVIFALIVLGIAFLIGYINYTFLGYDSFFPKVKWNII